MANIITKFAKNGVEIEAIWWGLPDWWEIWQVLKKTDSWAEWWDETKELPEWWNNWDVLTKVIWESVFDTQWPAPDWYHIPTQTEWNAVFSAWETLGAWDQFSWTSMSEKLKLPFSGLRQENMVVSNQNEIGFYWTPVSDGVGTADYFHLHAPMITWGSRRCSRGLSIRCFKNSPLIPTSSWTTIYAGSNGAWIYHNTAEWVISISSNWTTWYTMADKNLWATTVYNKWDTLSEANCGKYYQWWNNYGFPRAWTISKTSSTQVDASSYWPWNYYNSDTWITTGYWDSSDNKNIWWWVTQWIYAPESIEWKETKALPEWWEIWQVLKKTDGWAEWWDETKELPELWENWQVLTVTWWWERDTQWPAPAGYHVPTTDEWKAVFDAWVALGQWSSTDWNSFRIKMKMPFAGDRFYGTSNVSDQGSRGYYWSSTAYSANKVYRLYFDSSSVDPQEWSNRAAGFSVRCFRNSTLAPDSSWTTIYEWSNWAWIYHSVTEWVISISSDWITWYTIADKNLWATQVYNDGDSLSEANCGYYYQRWNNYSFPWTWTVGKIGRTAIDASAYWPWNYYSSNTFLIVSPWDSSDNLNLRWWVTDLRPEKRAEWKDSKALPEWWEVWQVLTRTEEWASWEDASIKARWIDGFWSWTSEEYSEIAHDADTLYFII